MRVNLLIALLVLSLCAFGHASGGKRSHSVTWGAREFRDTLLERIIVKKDSKFMRKVSQDYTFHKLHYIKITQIVITDMQKNSRGGHVLLLGGGPGANYAKLHFKSQRNNGLHFNVDIYGQSYAQKIP